MRRPHSFRSPHAGFSLVEVLVGLVIGIVALLLVYQVFSVAEGYKRTATSGGDAQTTGLVSTFLLAQELASAGSTLASTPGLDNCPNTGDFATTWRPIPVLIHDGGAATSPDALDVFYGVSPILVVGNPLRNPTPAGVPFQVQSPTSLAVPPGGYRVNDLVVVTGGGTCETARVTGVAPAVGGGGYVDVSTTPVANAYPQNADLVNLGADPNAVPTPANPVRKIRYDVCPSPVGPCGGAADGTLRSLDLITAGAAPNPIASNVVLMKAQYGLDTNGDRFIDTWQPATGAWSDANVLGAPIGQLRQIKAIRVAMIVRSAQFERSRDAQGNQWAPYLDADFTATLFDCRGVAPPACTGEIPGVTLPGSANYRYRVFEQVIPLRSQIWNF